MTCTGSTSHMGHISSTVLDKDEIPRQQGHFMLEKTGQKVKSTYKPSGPSGRSLSRFLKHEATENISTPSWMGC